MKRIINISIIIVGMVFLNTIKADAQYIIKEADQQFDLFNYDKAVGLYKTAFEKKKTLRSAERLAESYRLMRNFKEAEVWYATLSAMEGVKPEDILWYAEMLKNNAKYLEAKNQYEKYASLNKNQDPKQLTRWQLACDSAIKWMKYPKAVAVKGEKTLNSSQSDWGAVKYAGSLVFSSDRGLLANGNSGKPFLKFDGDKLPDRNIYGWTGNHYLRVYELANQTSNPILFSIPASSDYHISSATFSADGNEVFFAQTLIPKSITKVKGVPSTINIEIFSSKKENGTWSSPIPFRYNNVQQYSVGDPFLSKDGKLYFVSNMPGGKGGTDIYYCTKNADGSWSEAINMDAINTIGNERTPNIGEDGLFYFATDGYIGMGGLDIFSANIKGTNVQNLGYPINSPQDDFSYNRVEKLKGYFASNRDGGMGSDDIYSFTEKEKIIEKPIYSLAGQVISKETNNPIAGVTVSLNKANGSTVKTITDANGMFNFGLEEKSDYTLAADKSGFMKATGSLTTVGLTKSTVLKKDLYLSEIVIGKAIRIDNIFYDFDKANIRTDAAIELDKIVEILKENPTIWIELGSHTDSRGNDLYNLKLSQNRATSAVQYIISKGIAKERVTGKGYGETMLVNECKNGVKCSDEEHQLNRRTEFKIVKQ